MEIYYRKEKKHTKDIHHKLIKRTIGCTISKKNDKKIIIRRWLNASGSPKHHVYISEHSNK